ncbi:hypothetical protein [Chloroflexus sp.]|uniref:hypothetical protein n=1 Tax=Chloroflexus sp. TaxID=1904827 RepID=UPI00262C9301|nr:hypothetical protein [uncultured Chloroflexus sp.]
MLAKSLDYRITAAHHLRLPELMVVSQGCDVRRSDDGNDGIHDGDSALTIAYCSSID